MANPKESELHYPWADVLPASGEVLELAPGVRWVRMQLPFALDHINLWLLRDVVDGVAGWTIVDCGIHNEATQAAWEQVFANHLDGLPVVRVVVTHFHPDHIGSAHWLCERWGLQAISISATDFNLARLASQSTVGTGGGAAADFFAKQGLTDPESQAKIRGRSNYYASMVPKVPSQFARLMHGMRLRIGAHDWQCHVGYGHAPEHMSLHCEALNMLISGDMVLPRISTNVSVVDVEPLGNPLRLYLDSIEQMLALPPDTLVLPAHGRPFKGLHQRIRQLREHHDERLLEVMQACSAAPQSAADLLPILFKRPLDLHQTTFAIGEAIAHLHLLWFDGRLTRLAPGSDGVLRFTLA